METILIIFLFFIILYFLIARLVQRSVAIIIFFISNLFEDAKLLTEEQVHDTFERSAKAMLKHK